jgi:hypothetical protein
MPRVGVKSHIREQRMSIVGTYHVRPFLPQRRAAKRGVGSRDRNGGQECHEYPREVTSNCFLFEVGGNTFISYY